MKISFLRIMVIEESITINADVEKIWKVFTDLSCWNNWTSVIRDVCCNEQCLTRGKSLTCCFSPFSFPINVKIEVEQLIPHQCVIWSVRKKGFFAHHEFLFQRHENGTLIISKEMFTGVFVRRFSFLLPKKRMRMLTKTFLRDLKKASEG